MCLVIRWFAGNSGIMRQLICQPSCASYYKRQPNDCIVRGAFIIELGAQQCHMLPKVECYFNFSFMLWF